MANTPNVYPFGAPTQSAPAGPAPNNQINPSTAGYRPNETYNWTWDPTAGVWYDTNSYVIAPAGTPGPDQIGQYNGPPSNQGVYWNPTTKSFAYVGAGGKVTGGVDPNAPENLPNQEAGAAAQEKIAQDRAKHALDEAETDRQRQIDLANALNTTITDPNAPSVAREQLAQATQANEATQLSSAAGSTGQNAFLARQGAARNTAALNQTEAQQQALLRAKEVADAQGQLGTVLGQVGSEDLTRYNTDTGTAGGYSTELIGANQKTTDQGQAASDANWKHWLGLGQLVTTGVGSIGSSAVTPSDRNLKEDVHPEPDTKVMAFLTAIQPDSFKYKGEDPAAPDHHGVMAQDLEKSDIGRSLVHQTPKGKMVDVASAAMAALASAASLHRRIAKLEGGKRG